MGTGCDLGGGMAHFLRLIWFAVGVLLAALPMLSSAADYKLTGVVSYSTGGMAAPEVLREGYFDELQAMIDAVCASAAATNQIQGQWQVYTKDSCSATSVAVRVMYRKDSSIRYVYTSYETVEECISPNQWNPATQQCEPPDCPEGQVRNPWFGNCQDECPQAGGLPSRSHVTAGNAVCLHGCKRTRAAHPGGSSCVRSLDMFEGGGSELICDYAYTGEMCGWFGELAGDDSEPGDGDPPGEENPNPPNDTCPAGMQSGTFNGKHVCLKAGETTSQQQSTTTNNTTTANNTTTNVNTTTHTSTNYNSTTNTTTVTTTTTTNTTTTNNVTNESTTNTTTNVTESVLPGNQSTIPGNGGAPNGENGASGQCDPAVEDCGSGGSSFSGACGEPPLCMGDALQCAIARHTHETQCALQASEEVMEAWAAIRDFAGTGEGEGLDRKQIEVPTALDVTEVGAGAGLSDETYSIMGRSIVIPFSEMNRFIAIFGYAIMVIAWIGAWRIIAGAF